jgi:hypothetical protein
MSRMLRALRLLLLVLGAPGAVAASEHLERSPAAESIVAQFIAAVRDGDMATINRLRTGEDASAPVERHFAWGASVEPNLAFLVRRPFEVGSLASAQWAADLGMGGIPWAIACPSCLRVPTQARVTVPIMFADAHAPFLLPPHLAFGTDMRFVQFIDYAKRPHHPEYLTLRIRPTLEPGLIPPPAAPAPRHGSLLVPAPRDPAAVVLPSRAPLTTLQLGTLMPRVTGLVIEVLLSRSTRFNAWRIDRFSAPRVTVRGLDATLTVDAR